MIATEVKNNQKQITNELHVILGVNGDTGKYLVKFLVQAGYKVRGVSRSGSGPKDIETIKANALNINELTKALHGASVIYHCLGIPYTLWFDQHPKIMRNLIQAAAANGSQTKIVFADNMYAYGEKGAKIGPINEETAELATDKKGILRSELGKMLLTASKEGLVRVSIGRASDFFGPEATNSIFNRFVLENASKNKKSKMFADLDTTHSWMYLPDFARSLMTLGIQDKADGHIWILPHFNPTTIRKFVEEFYEVNGIDIKDKVGTMPNVLLDIIGIFNKDIREYSKMSYQRKSDWIADDTKFRETFPEWSSTDLNIAFSDTFDWYKISHQ